MREVADSLPLGWPRPIFKVATRWRLAHTCSVTILTNALKSLVRASGFEPETY